MTSSALRSQYSIAERFAGILNQHSSNGMAYHCKLFGPSLSTIGRSALHIYLFAIYGRITGGFLEAADPLRYFCISLLRIYTIISVQHNPYSEVTVSQLKHDLLLDTEYITQDTVHINVRLLRIFTHINPLHTPSLWRFKEMPL